MPRKFPGVSVPKWDSPKPQTEWTLQLKVITPIFGGGYKAREVDPVCVIRPAAIRGHLRFWWRATVGASYASPQELFEAEEKIWGSVDTPGKVLIRVESVSKGGQMVCLDRAFVPDYVRAILIQETPPTEKRIREQARREKWDKNRRNAELKNNADTIQKEKDELYPFVLTSGISFHLKLTFDGLDQSQRERVASSLKAYVLFGGVGGRTRRGYGSLHCDSLPEEVARATLTLESSWWSGIKDPPPGCMSLSDARLYIGNTTHAEAYDAWEEAVRIFRHFRRAELPGNQRPNRGQGSHSTWPEADMIRQMQNPPIPIINSTFSGRTTNFAFPRAQLGLPLVFQSMRDHYRAFGKAELKLLIGDKEFSRLASSVILKSIKLDGKWYSAILILNQTPIRAGDLRVSANPCANATVDCSNAPVSLWNGSAEKPFSHSHSSVLDVLEEYLKSEASWTRKDLSTL